MPPTVVNGFDAAIVDRDNHAVALVEVKAHPVERWATLLAKRLAKSDEQAAFVFAVDPNGILVYRPGGEGLGEPIVRLDTGEVLSHYDPEFPGERVFESYLVTLVEAWLRDLAYHWKSDDPPGSEELRGTGLLERLEGGTTQRLGA